MTLLLSKWSLVALIPILLIYWGLLRSQNQRIWFIALVSMFAFATLHPTFALVMLVAVVIVHRTCRRIGPDDAEPAVRRERLGVSIFLLLVFWLTAKYFGDLFRPFFAQDSKWVNVLVMPLGVSYFSFRCLQLIFDHYRGGLRGTSFRDVFHFLFFLPTLAAGPLESFQGLYAKQEKQWSETLCLWSLRRFAWGCFKKLFIVELVFVNAMDGLLENALHASSPALPWTYVVLRFVHAYFDLSAYTDIAIGLSGLFGFRIMENFRKPFIACDLADFWRRWHISVAAWCKNNIYFPVFGITRKPWIGLYASMLMMGLWHYINANWVLWALHHGSGLVVLMLWSRLKPRSKRLVRLSKTFLYRRAAHVLTLTYVAIGYAYVGTHGANEAYALLARLFGLSL